ncbi:TPA: 50S ribosomal protein L19 [Candidatus Berkelbacteria bacterium]|uniref:50S ribosomal protein L19 n=1 Tax=Berkelbacteria bacterium GW2011_GWE1_39_12 TaxID=1618337 RepID=A0A0G4B3F1_9BACT|nr:MAG: 50S ribosomal protein L19, large subunit ribosomal protein L19 [Berkelbacteria bacterium GW2011_GWE1_39_12]HBO60690.1 50S ribosomal protein L19 [Candidatus Berkelbacteria bacterium]
MQTENLIKKFGKQNVPEIRPGDTIKVHFKITEGNKTRIQIFEGMCIGLKHGKGLDGSVKVRKISSGIGVERTFPLHSPLITKFEKVKSVKVSRAKLYFLRDLIGKKKKRKSEIKSYGLWEEAMGEEEVAKIEAEKAKLAEAKAAQKAEEEAKLKDKFEQAVASHIEEATEEKPAETPEAK